MKNIKKLDTWHKTKLGYATFALVELLIAYGLGSRAIDTGSWWQYSLTVLFLVGSVKNLFQIFKNHDK